MLLYLQKAEAITDFSRKPEGDDIHEVLRRPSVRGRQWPRERCRTLLVTLFITNIDVIGSLAIMHRYAVG